MAAVFASKGFDVVGLDHNRALVDALNAGKAPVDEPRLQALITASASRLRATVSVEDAILGSDVTFVIVPTPSGPDAFFTNEFVVEAVHRIGSVLASKPNHLVVITSTVMPGSTGGVIRAALEQTSRRTVGHDVGLCYSPEFIALGSVVSDLLHPDFVLIGECNRVYGDRLESIYRATTESQPRVHRMNFVNAEVCKIAVNTFVTTKISYANMLAELCDRLDGADVDVITSALGADSRIGAKYLKGGVAYGGPCFPRDNRAYAALSRSLGVRCDLAEATDRINDHQVERLFGALDALATPGSCIAVLGLSYKLDTPVIENSQGASLTRVLLDNGFRVIVADPLRTTEALAMFGPGLDVVASLELAVAAADLVVITTPWPAIRGVPAAAFARPEGKLPVIDPWGVLKETDLASGVRLVLLGRGGDVARSGDLVESIHF